MLHESVLSTSQRVAFEEHLKVLSKKIMISDSENVSSLSGAMAKQIFFLYHSKLFDESSPGNLKNDLRRTIKQINSQNQSISNVDGMAGFGWAMAHLNNCEINLVTEDFFLI